MLIKATVFLISTIGFCSPWPEPFDFGFPFIDTSSRLNRMNGFNMESFDSGFPFIDTSSRLNRMNGFNVESFDSGCPSIDTNSYLNQLNRFNVSTRKPVILVPGLAGSQLEAKLDKSKTVNPFCAKFTGFWYSLWLNPVELLPGFFECFLDNAKLVYDNQTRRTHNRQGVKVRTREFGSTRAVESVSREVPTLIYMFSLIQSLVKIGYERDINIHAAPYDFRKSPLDNKEYIEQVKGLIEMSYGLNDKEKSILICHSLGCLYSLNFLNQMTPEWKEKFVDDFISIGAPYGGSVSAVVAELSGSSFGPRFIELTKTFSSLPFLFPSKIGFNESQPIVEIGDEMIGLNNYEKLFDLSENPTGYEMFRDSSPFKDKLVHPGIDTTCIIGTGQETVERIVYDDPSLFPFNPKFVTGEGDSTVNIGSLRSCSEFALGSKKRFQLKEFPGKSHLLMMYQCDVIDFIVGKVTSSHGVSM